MCLDEKENYFSSAKNGARVATDIEILTSTIAALRLEKSGKKDLQLGLKDHSIVLSHERSFQWDKGASAVIFGSFSAFHTIMKLLKKKERQKRYGTL